MAKKLMRFEDQKMIGGVCSGLAAYMELDVSLVRLLFVAIAIITALLPMLIFYIIAWIVIPAGRLEEVEGDKPAARKKEKTEKK